MGSANTKRSSLNGATELRTSCPSGSVSDQATKRVIQYLMRKRKNMMKIWLHLNLNQKKRKKKKKRRRKRMKKKNRYQYDIRAPLIFRFLEIPQHFSVILTKIN